MGGFRFFIAALVSVAAMQACGQSGGPSATPRPTGTGNKTGTSPRISNALADAVTYDSWVKDYLTKNCTNCHAHKAGETWDLASYAKAKANAQASLDEMKSGSMPQGGPKASSDQISKMQAWITGGTLERKPTSATPPTGSRTGTNPVAPTTNPPASAVPSANLTWTRDIQPIFRASCGLGSNGCHSPQSRYKDLTTLDSAKRYTTGIRTRVNSRDMPRGNRLSDTDIQKIVSWVNQGAN